MKRTILAIISVLLIFTLTACATAGSQGERGPQGEQGIPGINGVDGATPTISISDDGYWVINGVKTEFKAAVADACEHAFDSEKVSPTCTSEGYTAHTCRKCRISYSDSFVEKSQVHSYENALCIYCGKEEKYYVSDGDYIYFGEYPQSLKADDILVGTTPDDRGYYLGSDGFYYAKVTATPYASGYYFSTGDGVVSGTTYYFKVEPIRWRILTEEDGKALLFCDSIIEYRRYDDSSNNWAESEIRQWLNETFYTVAFDDLQRELIVETMIDNSPASTGYETNQYACPATIDNVFLLSYAETVNPEYGFLGDLEPDEAKIIMTSDYSRSKGATIYTDTVKNYGAGKYFLRSPSCDISYCIMLVGENGCAGNHHWDAVSNNQAYGTQGICPALWITLG